MADDLSRSGFSPETVQREQDPLEEGAGISEPEEAPCLDESMAIAPDNTDELLGSADEAHTPEFPALPPPRSVATPAKPGRYPAPEDTIQLLKELFAGGIMEKGQYEERRKQTPLPDHPFCYTPELDQSIHMFVQLMKTKVGRSAALKIDEASDKQLRDCQDQMIMALAPILMLDHHYNSESLDLDTARDLAVRAAEFLARGIKLQSYQRRLLVLHALNLRNKETEATCYNVWDHNPSPMRGPTSTRAPELFGQILQQDIFSKAKSAMDTCDSMAPLVCPKPQAPLHRPFLNSRGGNSRGRGAAAPYARPPRGFNRTAHQGASSSKSSTPTPTPTKVFKAVRYKAPFDLYRSSVTVDLPQAGLLRHFAQNWACITNDPLVKHIVSGYKINLRPDLPVHQDREPKQLIFGPKETVIVNEEVSSLLKKGAIVKVPSNSNHDGGFVSKLFVIPKKDGGVRPIIDLSLFNEFVVYEHFKMEGIFLLKDLLVHNEYMAKVDLKDAYLSVPIFRAHHKFLRFRWQGILYQFVCLCFGLSSAPRVFTKVLKPIVSFFRQLGVKCIIYLDDILFLHPDPAELACTVEFFCQFVQALGFLVNREKSNFQPTRQISFLGFQVCSQTMSLTLSEKKVLDLAKDCEVLRAASQVPARKLAAAQGKFAASSAAILPVQLYSRHTQMFLARTVAQVGWDTPVSIPFEIKQEISLWLKALKTFNGKPIHMPTPQMAITCDASLTGWGAHSKCVRTHGTWSSVERSFHINFLELKAAFLAVQSFARDKSDIHIRLSLDNATAIAYINKQGGTKSARLCDLALEMWNWCLDRNILISADYIPGAQNTIADSESRSKPDSSDWCLDHSVFCQLSKRFGSPALDLFASRHNAHTIRFYSRLPDPYAERVDAFNQDWSSELLYAFPPFNLIGKCLQKVINDKANLILITPLWPGQNWYPLVLACSCQPPLLLPKRHDLLISPLGEFHPLLNQALFYLVAWKVSGSLDRILVFRKTLPIFSTLPGQDQHTVNTLPPSTSGMAGVTDNRLIHFNHLS